MIVHGTGFIDSAGDGYATSLKGFKRGEGELSHKYDVEECVFGACAGAALYRRKMLEEIGFLDEDFFIIHEDTDLNLRAQLAGWKVKYVPSAIVHHKVRSTIGHMSDSAVYYTLRNSEFVRIKNIPLPVFLRCLPGFLLGVLSEFIYFGLKHRRMVTWFRAKMDALKALGRMLPKRRRIMKELRKADNDYLYGLMTPVWEKEFLVSKLKKFIRG
jgi:GT2 family glycosyltransferase